MKGGPSSASMHSVIAVSWSAATLAVTVAAVSRGHPMRYALSSEVIPKGCIDCNTGEIVDPNGLRRLIQKHIPRRSMICAPPRIHIAIPSAATYVHSWFPKEQKQAYSAPDVLEDLAAVLPCAPSALVVEIVKPLLLTDRTTCLMVVAARRKTVHAYLDLMGTHARSVQVVSTGEIARYNLACLLYRELMLETVLVVSLEHELAELTMWSGGSIRLSERIVPARQDATAESDARSADSPCCNRFLGVSLIEQLATVLPKVTERSAAQGMKLDKIVLSGERMLRDALQSALESSGIPSLLSLKEEEIAKVLEAKQPNTDEKQVLLDSLATGEFNDACGVLTSYISPERYC